jgi:porin
MHVQHNAINHAAHHAKRDALLCRSSPKGLVGSDRCRLLTVILVSHFIGISLVSRLPAQRINMPIEDLSSTNLSSTEVPSVASDSRREPVSRLVDIFRDHQRGIFIEPVYYGEVFSNTRGGISTNGATQYQALLDLPISLDFEKMQLPLPGNFFLLAQNTHGRGVTEDFVGDTLVISDIDSFDNIMQVSEYWWEFGLLDDNMIVRVGKQDLNTEFVYMDTASEFIQSSFELTPSAGLPSFPDPSMAAVVLMQLNSALQFKVGVWDALASGGSWGFSGNDTMVVIGELEYRYALGTGQFPGTIAVAAAYASEGAISGAPFGSSGGYAAQIEQAIYLEGGDNEQGLGIFAAYYPRFADPPIVAKSIGDNFVAGLVYTGLIPNRDQDVLGSGVAWAELFQGGTNEETVVELFYKAQLTPRTSVQPDLQYIFTPSGIHRDALAVGVRFQVNL